MRRFLTAILLAAGAFAGCETRPTNPGSGLDPNEAQLARKSARTTQTAHVLQFSTDITSAPIANVMMNPDAPFSNLAHPTTPITLPDVPELVGCGLAEGGNWTPYAGDWTGYIALTGDGTTTTLNFTAYAADGTPFWLSASGATTSEKVGASTTLTFTDVTTVVKMDRYPLVVILPCATFSLTATPQ